MKGFNGASGPVSPTNTDSSLVGPAPNANEVDWVKQGKVTPIQN
jgi:hypothetical protein